MDITRRLGVGAAIPESSSMLGRDAERLKHRLAGKKRGRDEEHAVVNVPSEDEEESRAGAIKKKAKLDPFAQRSEGKGKKAKKDDLMGATSSAASPVASAKHEAHEEHAHASEVVDVDEADDRDSSPRKKKKKKKKHAKTAIVDMAGSPATVLDKPTSCPGPSEPGPSTLSTPAKPSASTALHNGKRTGKSLRLLYRL